MIDKTRIAQVLSILLDNATKYSAAGVAKELSIFKQDTFITVAVKDAGDGISAAAVDNIFERFVRFSKRTAGLGLPTAKAIIEAHGGTITVVSVQGEGSTFSLTLPTEKTQ